MGRSVSYPSDCSAVCFRSFECEGEFDAEFELEYFVDWIKESATAKFPSLCECDKWLGREDHAILENDHACVGVSEYCGLVAIWLKAKDEYPNDHPELSRSWTDRVSDTFHGLFAEYRKLGHISNGEGVFEKIVV